jgi:hypothetical protein
MLMLLSTYSSLHQEGAQCLEAASHLIHTQPPDLSGQAPNTWGTYFLTRPHTWSTMSFSAVIAMLKDDSEVLTMMVELGPPAWTRG